MVISCPCGAGNEVRKPGWRWHPSTDPHRRPVRDPRRYRLCLMQVNPRRKTVPILQHMNKHVAARAESIVPAVPGLAADRHRGQTAAAVT
jgi:hypothetical protein